MVKQFVLAALSLVTASGVFFSGCAKKQETGTTGSDSRTLTIGIQANSFITDYKNNYLTKYVEDLHHITINFYMLPIDAAELRTKLALMVSSNDMPDIIVADNALPVDMVLDYGSKGAFIPLNKYLNDPAKAPNFAAIGEPDKTNMLNSMISADGNIYSLPKYEPESWNLTPHRLYINQAWLNKLGLQVPATTEELRNVLIAFRDQDPNGNGKKDEIGLYGFFDGGYGENSISALINSFIFYNQGFLSLDASGEKVIAPFTEPNFRKALTYLNGLYRERLLAASLFTDNQQQFRAALNAVPPVVGLTTAGSTSNWAAADTNPNFMEMTLIPPFAGPDGVRYTPYTGYVPNQTTFITSKCKNPDLAFQVMESFFDPEVSIIVRFGEEGADWTRNPEDLAKDTNAYVSLGLYPALTLVQTSNVWYEPANKNWHNINPRYSSLERGNTVGSFVSPYRGDLPTAKLMALNYQQYLDKHPLYVLPPLRYSTADSQRNAEPIATINEYVRQSIAEFVTSARDIGNDNVWNAYLRELNNMGLQQWLSSSQETYNRQKQ